MDLSRYWLVIRDQWVFFLFGLVATASLAGFLAMRQPDVYEASGTFVVRPRVIAGAEGGEVVRAIDALNRSVELSSTYAFIARSDLIKDRAKESVGGSFPGTSVAADLVPGTNVIEISVTGPEPTAAGNLAVAIGQETVAYIGNLQDAFELVPLDPAQIPSAPVGPNRGLTVGFGVFFGVAVGTLLSLFAHLVREWRQRPSRSDVTDPYTGVYSEEYFNARFRQELLRAKRRRQGFCVGLMKAVADHGSHQAVPTRAVLRQVAMALQGHVAEDEVLAYLGDGVFGTILLGYDHSRADWQLKQWQKEVETVEYADAGQPVSIRMTVGVANYGQAGEAVSSTNDLVADLL